ncbi:MAG: SpoIVB peptidase [Oscillospiraceae bacterium]|nr:SpoIVB peptidase [Oscillospiraceae bacterium]
MKKFIKFFTSVSLVITAIFFNSVFNVSSYCTSCGNNQETAYLSCSAEQTKLSTVLVSGAPFGIKILTDGIVITDIADTLDSNKSSPAKASGLLPGDIINSVDGTAIFSNNDLENTILNSEGRSLQFLISRGDKKLELKVTPEKTSKGYKIGAFVRDSCAGIGSMTFYNPENGSFAGLGHAVCDYDTGKIMPIKIGEIADVKIIGVVKGKTGVPGELIGAFLPGKDSGEIKVNCESGLYGIASPSADCIAMEVAPKSQIKTGPAKILTTVDGSSPREFDISIEKIHSDKSDTDKNLVIKITDPELLEITGGIVPGMSGSPIIQNGKLVGAVTHVFVNEPTKGYAIFTETMLYMSYFVE